MTESPGGRLPEQDESKALRRNGCLLWLGAIACLGALTVVCFNEQSQELNDHNDHNEILSGIHGAGAVTFFGGTFVYLACHSWLDANAVHGGLCSLSTRRVRLGFMCAAPSIGLGAGLIYFLRCTQGLHLHSLLLGLVLGLLC